jgi:hypothetical protein
MNGRGWFGTESPTGVVLSGMLPTFAGASCVTSAVGIVERTAAHMTQGDITGRDRPAADQSVSSALDHLVAGSQGVLTKRIAVAASVRG